MTDYEKVLFILARTNNGTELYVSDRVLLDAITNGKPTDFAKEEFEKLYKKHYQEAHNEAAKFFKLWKEHMEIGI